MPKDACYHKVKSRYKVFPSAYASGAIAKCRKVGAANYGKSYKKNATGGIIQLSGGGLARRKRPSNKKGVARGCGIVQENRRKVTQYR
jgi:hypothetical protein